MSQETGSRTRERVSLEDRILRLLCSNSLSREDLHRAINNLTAYTWVEPEHDVVFQAVQRVATGSRRRLRDELPAQLTRMGFPDVNWPQYLAAVNEKSATFDELFAQLIGDG
jgi:hypothetical protein